MRCSIMHFMVFVSVLLPVSIAGETPGEKALEKAKKLYSNEEYDKTISVLKDYLSDHGRDKETIKVVPLLMEALMRVEEHRTVRRLYRIYLRNFPDSDFVPRLHYLRGMSETRKDDYEDAVEYFSEALNSGLSGELKSLTLENVKALAKNSLEPDELQDLNEEDELHPDIREITEYYEFAKLADKGEKVKAGEKAKEYREKFSGQYSKKASHLEKTGKRYKRNRQTIGLLCPLTGSEAELGEKIHNSVLMAVKRYNAASDKKIDLVVRDTRGDPVETGHHTKELLTQHHVAGIIGPVMSSTAAVTAAMLTNYPNVLMITPTATDYGIGSYGSNIFQLNVTLESLGASIADYAVKNLNIKEFAIISPESDFGEKLLKSFSDKVEQLGGKILETQVYSPGKNDFKEEFRELRIAAFQENEVDLDISKELDGLDKESLQTMEDSTAEIGGLFLPAPADDIVKLAPQTFFHKIEAQLLGTNSWHNTKVIMDGKKYVNGAFFSAGFKYKESNNKWKACRSLYETKFGKDPGGGIEIPLSYDAAVLVLKALRKRNPIEYLANIEDYDATAGFITFNKNGINIRSSIYKIADRDFVKIK